MAFIRSFSRFFGGRKQRAIRKDDRSRHKAVLALETLESRLTPTATNNYIVTSLADGVGTVTADNGSNPGSNFDATTLRAAITAATADGGNDTITFAPGIYSGNTATISLSAALAANNSASLGAAAFVIGNNITIQGPTGSNTLTIAGGGSVAQEFRFATVTSAGTLSLNNVTLSSFYEAGGNGGYSANSNKNGGGGGLGAGGAILNEGTLNLSYVTIANCTAIGGNGGAGETQGGTGTWSGNAQGGGGGMGASADVSADAGGPNGATASTAAGVGGGGSGVATTNNVHTGGFGGGGAGDNASNTWQGSGSNGGYGGGGGGAGYTTTGDYLEVAGAGGFGAGAGDFGYSGNQQSGAGGGGSGQGGAIFNLGGTITISNSTIVGNSAIGGNGGVYEGGNGKTQDQGYYGYGLGGGVFNLNGTVAVTSSSITSNGVANGTTAAPITYQLAQTEVSTGSDFYNLSDGDPQVTAVASKGTANVTLTNATLGQGSPSTVASYINTVFAGGAGYTNAGTGWVIADNSVNTSTTGGDFVGTAGGTYHSTVHYGTSGLITSASYAGTEVAGVGVAGVGTPFTVSTPTPTVTSSSSDLADNQNTFTIYGTGFDSTPGNNTVTFNDGAVGPVTSASSTSLVVTFTTQPTTASSLTVIVTTDGVNSGGPVQVALVTPVVSSDPNNIPANSNSLVITGFGFDPNASNNSIIFSDGAVGTVTAATPTALQVTLTKQPAVAGPLNAQVTTDNIASGQPKQFATVAPVVTSSAAELATNAPFVTFRGFGFDPNPANNVVVFDDGAFGTVTNATANSLTVDFTTPPNMSGPFTAAVTTDGVSSGVAVQLGTVVTPLAVATSSLGNTTYGQSYNQTIQATGGAPSYTFTITTGNLPTGLSLSNSGTISGTANAAGSYTFTVQVADAGGLTASEQYTILVNQASLTVTANAASTTYGATLPDLNYTYVGLVNGDSSATFTGSLATTATSASNVGGYDVTAGTLAATGNYTIGTFNAATLTVTPALLTVTASDASTTYGASLPTLNYTYVGLVNGDGSASFTGSLATSATAASNVGGYDISVGTLAATGNYTVGAFNAATLTVTPALLTVTASDASTVYGGTLPALNYTYNGLVNGDSSASFSGSLSTTATPTSNAGGYAIDVGTLSVGGNYTIGTFNTGTLTITPALLTVTASDATTTYGTLPTLNYTFTGLVNDDISPTFTGSLAASGSNVGSYSISVGTLTATGNYTIGAFNAATLTVTPALLTVTASDASTTYGSTLPALSYTYTGLVNGDSSANFSGSVATTATSSSSVGGYGISVGTLAVSGNYAIGTFNAGTLTVTPALLAVTATSTSITVNSAIPPLSYTYTGLVNGDSSAAFTGGLTTTATSASNAGLYPINEGSLAVTGNYAIGSFTAGTLSIIPTGFVLTDNGPNASESGQAVSFTVTIGNNAVPNGQTIRIEDESNYFAIVASPVVNNGVATFTVSNLGLGVHYLIAEYGLPKTSGYGQSNIVAQTVMAGFGVGSVTATPGGVVLDFDAPINPNSTVLYSSPGDTTYGPADITVVGASTGPVRGSLVIDPTNPNEATFVQTSGLLPADTYTVTVTSAVTAADGSALSGNSVSTVVVSNTSTPVVSLPSFARGPGQSVVLTDSQGNATGLPVSISQVTGATQASFSLTFDPTLLTIAGSGALTLSTSATAAGMDTVSYTIVNVDSHHSLLTANITSSQPGGAGLTSSSAIPLVTITANVPSTAPYLNKALLNVSSVVVNGAAGAGVSAVDEAAYIGDVSGAGSISALDASLVDQVGAGSGTGFSAYKDLDPAIIGSVSGGADVSSLDASLINEAGAGAAIPGIPAIPTGMGPLFTGADPYLYLSSVQGSAGQTVTETLYLDVTDPNGIQLSALDEAIGFDAGALHVSNVRAAAGLAGLGSYQTIGTADNGSGVLLVGQAFAGSGLPPVVPYGTDVAVLQFDVTLNANASVGAVTGLTLLQDGTINGETKYTAISDNEGALTWTPGKVPSNTGNAAIDGSVTVVPYTAPADSEVVTPTKHSTDVVQSKASVVKRVVPSAPVSSTPVSQPALDILTSAPPATASSSDQPAASDAAAAAHVTIVIDVTVQSPLVLSVQAEANMVTISATTASLTTGTSVGRGTDPGVALSLAEVATNKATPAASTANVKSSTSTVDEMFRLLGSTLGVPQANASNTGASDTGMSDEDLDALDLEYLLLDQDSK